MRINLNLVPLLLLGLISLYTIYIVLNEPLYIDGELYQRSFNTPHYIGFGLLLLALGVYWWQRAYFKYAVVVLLSMWVVGIANYLPSTLSINVGLISLQLWALLFVVAYYAINSSRANNWLLNLVAVQPGSEKAKRMQREEIEKFKRRFHNYSTERLQTIVEEKKLVGNAVNAAREMLAERNDQGL